MTDIFRERDGLTLILRTHHLDVIVENSLQMYPKEACGILAGRFNNVKVVEAVFKARNILNSEVRYEIGSEEQLQIFQKIEKLGFEVVGFYHSHPYWEASPSATDTSLAFYKNASYAIYSVITRTLASYMWDGHDFIPEQIIII